MRDDSFIVNQVIETALNDLKAAIAGTNSGSELDVSNYRKELMTLLQSIKEGVNEIGE